MKRTKKLVRTISCVLLFLVAAAFAGGACMLDYALRPDDMDPDYEFTARETEESFPGFYAWYSDMFGRGVFRDTCVTNDRGFRLHAVYASAPVPDSARGTVVLAHGYTSNMVSMMPISRMYRDSLNFNILLFDQQFHGLSEGEAIQMGWLDRFNAALWTEVAHNIWHDSFMVVHGVSMGAATVMMLSGDPDPEWVSAYVEDCGYADLWDLFAKELRAEYGLPAFPLLNTASVLCRIRYGWGFGEASCLKQLSRSTKPMLFIHGDSDTYVLTSDIYRCYDAKTNGLRQMYLVKGAGHAQAFEKDRAGYTAAVRDFIRSAGCE